MLGNNSFNFLHRNKAPLIILVLVTAFFSFSFIPFVNATNSITYNASTKIITVIGSYGSQANWHVWNASYINGWGAVFNYDNMTYFYNETKLIIGNGITTTTFKDKSVHMVFNVTTEIIIEVKAKATFEMGELVDTINRVTAHGVSLLFNLSGGSNDVTLYGRPESTINLYGCLLENVEYQSMVYAYGATANVTFYECIFSGMELRLHASLIPNINAKRITQTSQSFGAGFGLYAFVGDLNDVYVEGNQYAIIQSMRNITGLTAKNSTYLAYLFVGSHNSYLINPDTDTWDLRLHQTLWTGNLFASFNYDLTVTYSNGTAINGTSTGARVIIRHYGENAGIDYNTTLEADGTISQQVLNWGFWNKTAGQYQDETDIYNYNPYNLRIYNVTGYDEYNANFTLNKKEDLTISLTETVEPITSMAPFFFLGAFIFIVIGALIFAKKH